MRDDLEDESNHSNGHDYQDSHTNYGQTNLPTNISIFFPRLVIHDVSSKTESTISWPPPPLLLIKHRIKVSFIMS